MEVVPMTPTVADKTDNGLKKVQVQKTFFDLDTFAEVTLRKEFEFTMVATIKEAETRLNNDAERLIKIINDGLISVQRAHENSIPTGWRVLTEDGEMNGEFSGTPADQDIVNKLVLQLAKTSIGPSMGLDWETANKDQKRAIREATQEFIKTTPLIRNGLKKSAALKEEAAAPKEGAAANE